MLSIKTHTQSTVLVLGAQYNGRRNTKEGVTGREGKDRWTRYPGSLRREGGQGSNKPWRNTGLVNDAKTAGRWRVWEGAEGERQGDQGGVGREATGEDGAGAPAAPRAGD